MTTAPGAAEDDAHVLGGDPLDGRRERARSTRWRVWTRQLHNYLGLYLLLFLWLFSVSGLVLNHPKWEAGQFWSNRAESTVVRPVQIPTSTGDLAIARSLMGQLAIDGEVNEIKRAGDGARFDFQVVKPGRVYRIEARLDSALARVTTIRLNAWGMVDALHKFTGVRMNDPAQTRDWLMTQLWSLSMDAVALGMIVLALSGIYLCYRLPGKRLTGLLALGVGSATCVFFLYGLGALLA